MNAIKVEVEGENELSCDYSCFICLKEVVELNEEQFNSINFLLNYLKIRDKVKSVCDNCSNHLMRLEKLSNILEKVRLEMDYLLDFIQKTILNSKGEPASIGFSCVRECVMKRCKEKMVNPKVEVRLQRLHTYSVDWSQDWDDDNYSPSSNSIQDSASPVGSVKSEMDLEDAVPVNKKKLLPCRKPAKCPKCSKTFCNRNYLKYHDATVHHNLKLFKCSKCSKSFTIKGHLREHFNFVHLRLKPYKCDECDQSFITSQRLRLHKAVPHQKNLPEPKPFPCKICKMTFSTDAYLKRHESRVHVEKKFSCDICKKMFKQMDNLKVHIRSVHEKRRHHCQVEGCDKSYSNSHAIVDHYKLDHPDFKPIRKDHSKRFKLTTENGETVVVCKLCQDKFESVTLVREHLKKKHGPSYLCQDCGYKTAKKSDFERHIERGHKIKTKVECKFCKKQISSVALSNHISKVHGEKKKRQETSLAPNSDQVETSFLEIFAKVNTGDQN